jgi:hypothetical protein
LRCSISKPHMKARYVADPIRPNMMLAKCLFLPTHRDLPDVRRDWAQYYDKLEEMDQQVGGVRNN